MTYVIRRTKPRHDGSRYFNDKGPPQRHPSDGAWFDLIRDAETAHGKLREPHLWEVLPLSDAEKRDAAEFYTAQKDKAKFPPLLAGLLPFIQIPGPPSDRHR